MFAKLSSRAGNSTLEFVLTGIPIVFVIMGIVEISPGMWIYDTLVHSVDAIARQAVVRGYDCATSLTNCPVTVGGYSQGLAAAANGLDPNQLSAVFTSASSA